MGAVAKGRGQGRDKGAVIWPPVLGKKDELRRAAAGLYAGKDGWYKTINWKKRYICRKMSLDDALAILPHRIEEIKGDASAARPARLAASSTTIKELSGIYLAHLWQRHTTGTPKKLSRRTYDDYADTLSRFVECIGPGEPASTAGPGWFSRFARTIAHKAVSSRRRDIIYLTAFFNWAGPGRHGMNFYRQPVNFGPDLVKPEDSALQAAMDSHSTAYTPEQFHAAMDLVKDCPVLWCAGLMALNCAFLGSDLTAIPESMIDLDASLHWFPRVKTGIKRKCWLLPETVAAIRRYQAVRTRLPEAGDLLFVRDDGRPYNLRRRMGPDGKASHGNTLGVYWREATRMPIKGLRTTFATAADGVADQPAVDLIMGHRATSIRQKHYVKSFDPARLRVVVEQVAHRYVAGLPQPGTGTFSAADLLRFLGRRGVAPSTRAVRPGGSGSEGA